MDRKREGYPDIALVGKAGSGKTTAANLLEQFGYRRWSFAGRHKGGMRDIAVRMFGEDAAEDREILNTLGMFGRGHHPNVWINNLTTALEQSGRKQPAVIDDMRMPDEWRGLVGAGFIIIRIDAPESLRVQRLKQTGKWQDELQLVAPTEIALDGRRADYTINNGYDVSLNEFEDRVVAVLRKERGKRA